MKLINYNNGELELVADEGDKNRFDRQQAYQLILSARMNTIERFQGRLKILQKDFPLLQEVLNLFPKLDHSAQWNLKEKFARLQTLAPELESPSDVKVVEEVLIYDDVGARGAE